MPSVRKCYYYTNVKSPQRSSLRAKPWYSSNPNVEDFVERRLRLKDSSKREYPRFGSRQRRCVHHSPSHDGDEACEERHRARLSESDQSVEEGLPSCSAQRTNRHADIRRKPRSARCPAVGPTYFLAAMLFGFSDEPVPSPGRAHRASHWAMPMLRASRLRGAAR